MRALFVGERLRSEGKKALLLVWDNARGTSARGCGRGSGRTTGQLGRTAVTRKNFWVAKGPQAFLLERQASEVKGQTPASSTSFALLPTGWSFTRSAGRAKLRATAFICCFARN